MKEISIDVLKTILTDKNESLICGDETYTKNSVLALLFRQNNDLFFIFEKRAKKMPQAGEICFPGGRFDPEKDISAAACAIRETKEELGIPQSKIEPIGFSGTVIAPMGALVHSFAAIASITSIDDCIINSLETERVFSIPLSFFLENNPAEYFTTLRVEPFDTDSDGNKITTFPAKELGLPEKYHTTWGRHKHPVYVYQYNDIVIWGITALIIRQIVSKIKSAVL